MLKTKLSLKYLLYNVQGSRWLLISISKMMPYLSPATTSCIAVVWHEAVIWLDRAEIWLGAELKIAQQYLIWTLPHFTSTLFYVLKNCMLTILKWHCIMHTILGPHYHFIGQGGMDELSNSPPYQDIILSCITKTDVTSSQDTLETLWFLPQSVGCIIELHRI